MENQTPVAPEVQSTVNSEQSTVEQKTPITVHSSPNTFLVVLLSVLLFVSVSIAGFFAYQTQKLVKELTMLKTSPTPEVTTEPVATVDPTADWNTYTDLKNRFVFKHPADVKIVAENGRLFMQIPNFDYPVSILPTGPHNWGEGLTKDQLAKIYIKAFQYPDIPEKEMYPDTDVQFVIEFMTLDDRNNAFEYLAKVDQILSTFKFTN